MVDLATERFVGQVILVSSGELLQVFFCCCSVTKSCLTLCDPMDCRLSSSSVHGISQEIARFRVGFTGGNVIRFAFERVSCFSGRV